MNKRQILFGVLLGAELLVSHAQNLITNGGFELVANPTNTITTIPVNSSNLPGWSIGGTGDFYVVTTPCAGIAFQAYDGRQFIDFNNNSASLLQSFSTIAGESYDVSFVVGHRLGFSMRVIAEVVSLNAVVLGTLDVSAPTNVGWGQPSRFRFTALTDTSTLTFRGTNAGSNVDMELDAVSVEPVVRPLSIQNSPLRLCWESNTNRSYQLQFRSTLITNSWTDLDAPIAGSGSIICNTQSVTEPQRFFRVVTLP